VTISKEERSEGLADALRAMLEIIGDGRLNVLFVRDCTALAGVSKPTWEKLLEGPEPRLTQCGFHFSLTAHGWIDALRAADKLCDAAMIEKLGVLCSILKRRCERRGGRHLESVTIDELSGESGYSVDWIYNVVDSHLIRICFNRIDCEWASDDKNKNHVEIPARFGYSL
jgi:hypothetical protein